MKHIQSHWDLDSDTQKWKAGGPSTAFSLLQDTSLCYCDGISKLQPQVTNIRAPAHSTDLHKTYLKPQIDKWP